MVENRATVSIKLDRRGFTLIELVIIIVVVGILAAFAVPRFSDITDGSKRTATLDELHNLKVAISGNPAATAGGEYIDRGFEGDVGYAPSRLQDLVVKPDSIAAYNKLTRIGWNGPYIDSSGGSYLTDAWGVAYSYSRATRKIVSLGSSDSLTVSF